MSHPIAEIFEDGRWWSGSTWDAHPLVCASIVGTIEYMLGANILDTVQRKDGICETICNGLQTYILDRPDLRCRPLLCR